MATPYPSHDGPDRRPRKGERMIRATFNVVACGAFLTAPVAAVSLWLLLTDPVLAGEVADRNSLVPVVRTLVVALGKAIAAVLAYL
jgi:hypothetical protein